MNRRQGITIPVALVLATSCSKDAGEKSDVASDEGSQESRADGPSDTGSDSGGSGTSASESTSRATLGSSDEGGSDVTSGSDSGTQGTTGGAVSHWIELAPLAAGPRQETAVVAADGKVFVIGGFDATAQVVATVEAYTPETDSWEPILDTPVAMHHANAGEARGNIYIVGFLTGNFVADGRVFEYMPDMKTWDEKTAMPPGNERGASAVASDGRNLFVLGGFRDGNAVVDTDVYDAELDEWFTLPSLPEPRDHVVAFHQDSVVYMVGGRDGTVGGHTNAVLALPLMTMSWSSRTDLPTSRGGMAGAYVDGRFFVSGGEGNPGAATGVFQAHEVYDVASDTWTELTSMPTPRHGTGAAAIGSVVYVPGGADQERFAAVDTHEAWVMLD